MAYNIGIDARKLTDFGIGTYIQNLVRAIAELDTENQYVLFAGASHQELLNELPDNFNVVVERSPVYSVRELLALSWRLLRMRLDLYHATHYVLPAVVPCRAVVTIHDIIHLLYPQFLPGPLAFLYAQRMIRRSLLRGDQIIAGSQNTKTDLMEYFEVDGRKINVVYYGVAERFSRRLPEAELTRVLNEYDLTPGYTLFVGNPKPHKNLDNVIRAYARATEMQQSDGLLVCVGNKKSRDFKIVRRAEQSGIGDRLRLLGHVDDDTLTALYQGADLFLYPTLYEGFGLPVVEAMASGVAVITSNNSALKEVAEGYAQLVNPLDVEEMARAIAQCLGDAEHRQALARLGAKRAEDFRWDRTAERTLAVYEKVLSTNGSG